MNTFGATLDTRHQNGVIGPITQYDNAALELQILSGGQIGDAWVEPQFDLLALKCDMNPVREVDQSKFTIISKEEHRVRIELKEQFLTCRGAIDMQLVIKDSGRLSTTIFSLSIVQSLDVEIIESIKDIKVVDDLEEVVETLSEVETRVANNEVIRQHNEKLREAAEVNRQEAFNQSQLQRDTDFGNKLEEFQEQVSSLEGIQGKPGETPQIQVNETHIQFKYPSQQEWTDLVALESLKGPAGPVGPRGLPGETGEPGKDGANGENGQDGVTPILTIGTVTTLEPGEEATVTITGTKENPILNISIPQGQQGENGEDLKEEIVVTPIIDLTLNLTTDKYQLAQMENNTEIVLPTVDKYTEIHLFFTTTEELTLTLPNIKWQTEPTLDANKTYEFIFTYANEWLGGMVVYNE